MAYLSLLDRLVPERILTTAKKKPDVVPSQEDYRKAVELDIEWLVNSRCPMTDQLMHKFAPKLRRLLEGSVLNFGVRDFRGTILSGADWEETTEDIRRNIENPIRRSEPRIKKLRVELA